MQSTVYPFCALAISPAVVCPPVLSTYCSCSSTGSSRGYTSGISAYFPDGTCVARFIERKKSISVSINRDCRLLYFDYFKMSCIRRHQLVVRLGPQTLCGICTHGGPLRWMYSPAVKVGIALRICRSWSSLNRRCLYLNRFSASWCIVAMQYGSFAVCTWEDVVAVTPVNRVVGLSCVVGEGYPDRSKVKGGMFVTPYTWALTEYVRGCRYMSQSLWFSAT